MQLSSDGQVTIPPNIRSLAGLMPGSEVEFQFDEGRVWLKKVSPPTSAQRQKILSTLAAFKGCATAHPDWRTEDILRLTRED